jgi:hypothetical protein
MKRDFRIWHLADIGVLASGRFAPKAATPKKSTFEPLANRGLAGAAI